MVGGLKINIPLISLRYQTYGRAVDRSHKLEIKLRAKRRRRRTERREKINDVVVSDPGLS